MLQEEGDFAESISETAKEVHANIMVMGSLSRKWLEVNIMGSVTGDFFNLTFVPLFFIPNKPMELNRIE
jgi:hypothetical protein